MTPIFTQTPVEKIQQYVDNQQFETAYQILNEEQKKLFEAGVNQKEFPKRREELIEALLEFCKAVQHNFFEAEKGLDCARRAEVLYKANPKELNKTPIHIYNNQGHFLNLQRNSDEAIKRFELALKGCNEFTDVYLLKNEAYNGIATSHENEEENEIAVQYYKYSKVMLDKHKQIHADVNIDELLGRFNNPLLILRWDVFMKKGMVRH